MSNHETVDVPMGLIDLTEELTKLKKNRERLDDMTERMQSALDHKRDVASSMSDELQEVMKRNHAMRQAGYDEGYKAGRNSEIQASEKRDRDLLEEHGIDVDGFVADTVKMIKDHEQDIDEDEPDQYPPEKWGGTK